MPFVKQKDLDKLLKFRDSHNEEICTIKSCDCEYWDLISCKFDECQKVVDGMQIFNQEKLYIDLVDRYYNYFDDEITTADDIEKYINEGIKHLQNNMNGVYYDEEDIRSLLGRYIFECTSDQMSDFVSIFKVGFRFDISVKIEMTDTEFTIFDKEYKLFNYHEDDEK